MSSLVPSTQNYSQAELPTHETQQLFYMELFQKVVRDSLNDIFQETMKDVNDMKGALHSIKLAQEALQIVYILIILSAPNMEHRS